MVDAEINRKYPVELTRDQWASITMALYHESESFDRVGLIGGAYRMKRLSKTILDQIPEMD